MKIKKIDRFGHAGKSYLEKEAYKNFLTSRFSLDKTEDEPVDTEKTNESSFEEENNEPVKTQNKSKWLEVRDFFGEHWVATIVGGIATAILMFALDAYVDLNTQQGIQSEKISNLEEDFEKVDIESKENKNTLNIIKESLNVFKTEVFKDLEFLKDKFISAKVR